MFCGEFLIYQPFSILRSSYHRHTGGSYTQRMQICHNFKLHSTYSHPETGLTAIKSPSSRTNIVISRRYYYGSNKRYTSRTPSYIHSSTYTHHKFPFAVKFPTRYPIPILIRTEDRLHVALSRKSARHLPQIYTRTVPHAATQTHWASLVCSCGSAARCNSEILRRYRDKLRRPYAYSTLYDIRKQSRHISNDKSFHTGVSIQRNRTTYLKQRKSSVFYLRPSSRRLYNTLIELAN